MDKIFAEDINMNIQNYRFQKDPYFPQNYESIEENEINDIDHFEKYLNIDQDDNKSQCNSIISFDEKNEEFEFYINKKSNDFDDSEFSEIDNLIYFKNEVVTTIKKLENNQTKKDEKIQSIVKTKSTEHKTKDIIMENQQNIKSQKKNFNSNKKIKNLEKKILLNNNKIFNISKVNKKVGRLGKKSKKILKGKHNKFCYDNIIRKIKVNFHNNIYNYINKKYEIHLKSINQKKITKLLQKISPEESKRIKKDDNLRWFSSKLKDVFSANLSSKCSLYTSDYNKRQIDKLYKEAKIQNLIDIFEKTIREIYEIYVNDIKLDGIETLEDDLKSLQNKMEKEGEEDIEEYLKEYKYVAQNLEQIFKDKKGRRGKIPRNEN